MTKTGIQPDLVAITAMVAGHVQHDRISQAIELFESIKKNGIRLTWKACSVFIKELCKASKPEEAVRILKEVSKSNTNVTKDIYRLVILSLNRKGDFNRAREVERMSRYFQIHSKEDIPSSDCGHHCTGQDYSCKSSYLGINNHVVASLTRNDGLDKLKQVEQASRFEVEPPTSNSQETNSMETVITFNEIDHQRVCRILTSSMEWSSMQEGLETSNVDFTPELVESVLWKCRSHGHASLKFFSWIRRRSGYKHTTEAYNMAIKIAGAAKDFIHMRDLYRDMKRFNCSITVNTWNIMIAQYGQAGLTEVVLKIFDEMKGEGYEPNGSTYKYLIIFLSGNKGRKLDEAIKLFQDMVHSGYMPDRELLSIYLSSLCELGRLVQARRSVNSLCERGFIPQLSYSLLIRALCRAGKLEEALVLANNIEYIGCKMDHHIYASIIHALLRCGRLDEALHKLDTMRKLGISETVHIYTSLIVHFCKEKDIGRAMEIFGKMSEEGCEPTVVTYSVLIRGLMNMGMISDAWNIFYRMKFKGPYPDFTTYSMFITCLCKDGRSEEGMKLIHEMIDSGIIPSAVNFRVVFHGLNREGKQDLAHSVLQSKRLLNRRRKFSI